MDPKELKSKMIKLWKDTFHDSDAYISLVFDNYFDLDLVEYNEENGKLVSALLGIPYEFSNGKGKLKGLYLCGLATEHEYRNRGIMNALLDRINDRATDMGFAFSFLIPANKGLINYYSLRRYQTAIYRVEDRYTALHDFEKDYKSSLLCEDERIRTLKSNLYDNLKVERLEITDREKVEKVKELISKCETNVSAYTTLLHSQKDLDNIIKENNLSGGKIFICYNKDNQFTGCAFISVDERKRIHVLKVYYEDRATLYRILQYIKDVYEDSPISLYGYPEEIDRRVLWEKVYGASNPDGGQLGDAYGVAERVYDVASHAMPYGMIRILNFREILKFIANDRSDLKFSILVKGVCKEERILKCDVRDGEALFREIDEEELNHVRCNTNVTILKERELLEILFRKKGSSNLIQEAFGIPRLPVNIALLLD